MTTTTDTPRTEAEIWDVVYHHKNEIVVDADFARELERELNELWSRFDKQMEAEAELERIYAGMQGSCYCCEPVGEMNQKLEAEVERLKKLLLTEKESDVVGLAIVNLDVHTAVERRCINSAASKLRQHKL